MTLFMAASGLSAPAATAHGTSHPSAAGLSLGLGIASLIALGLIWSWSRERKARLEAERQTRDTLEFNEKLLANMALGVLVFHGRSGMCVLSNPAVKGIIGGDESYFRSQNFREIPQWQSSGLLEAAERALATGENQHKEVHVITGAGKECWISCILSSFQIRGEIHLLVLVQDIHDRQRAETALRASESRLTSIFNASPAWISLTRLSDGRVIDINDAFVQISGWARHEVIGHTTQEIGIWGRPQDLPLVMNALREHGRFRDFETLMQNRDGTFRPVRVNGELLDLNGEPHLVAFSTDITEERKTEAALQRAFAALEQSPAMVFITDTRGIIEYVNEACIRISGYTKAEILGKSPRLFKSGKMSPDFYADLWSVLLGGQTWHGRFHNRRKDGSLYWEEATISPIRDEGGTITHYVAVKEDITDTLRLEAERRDLDRKLAQAQRLESLGRLAGGVAHDMNNVLAAILSIASLHEAQASEGSPLRKGMKTIERACLRARTLVQGLLGFARQGLAEEKILDLNAILREEATLLERTTLQKVRLEVELAEDLRPVLGDPSSLSHALMNLCINAVDAMPEGGTLTLRTRNQGPDFVQVEVIDTGSGMAPDVIEKAFDPFFTTKPQGKGTGLGLPMVYGTVKAHRGDLQLESRVGGGTTVRILLPASMPDAGSEEPPQPAGAADQKLRVLLVDDDELIQFSTGQVLEMLGHQVQIASRGEEALELLERDLAIDVIILDLNMPGMGGAASLPRIRVLRPQVPIFLATGRADQQAMDLAASVPLVTLLAKPYTMADLKELLQNL